MTALYPLYINGRFVTQSLSGVQRFATELSRALLALEGAGARMVVPVAGAQLWPGARETGRLHGQAWEQWELPRQARDGVLLNLGNTAPLLAHRQVLVIHDAGVYSTPEAYSWKFRSWYKTIQAAVIRRGVPIVTVSEFSRTEIIRHLPVQVGQVNTMPEGADHVQRIVPDPATLDQFGLERGRYVLAVGNLAAHKNLPALALLAERLCFQGMRLVVAGNVLGGAFSAAGAQQLPAAAYYIGRVTDSQLKALYEAACCFVFPSRYEGFGLPAVEAMASGCPVVAADIPALHETCGEAALYCDPAWPDDIAAQVLLVCNDTALQSRLRAAGRQRVASMTWQRAALALQDIVSSHYGVRT